MNSDDSANILNDNIYRLLLKNVTRNDPFTSDEVDELKSFRRTLTDEQWHKWLKFARDEKKKLRNKENSITSQCMETPKYGKGKEVKHSFVIGEDRETISSSSNKNMIPSSQTSMIERNQNLEVTMNSRILTNQKHNLIYRNNNIDDDTGGVSLDKGKLTRTRNISAPPPSRLTNNIETLSDKKDVVKHKDVNILPSPKQRDVSKSFDYEIPLSRINNKEGISLSSTNSISKSAYIHSKSNEESLAIDQTIHRNAEIARTTNMRLESACSAAEYLLKSLNEEGDSYNFHSSSNKEVTLSIISEMMASIKKSKSAIAQLRLGLSDGTADYPTSDQSVNNNNNNIYQRIPYKEYDDILNNTIDLNEPHVTHNDEYNGFHRHQPLNLSYQSDQHWRDDYEDDFTTGALANTNNNSKHNNIFNNLWNQNIVENNNYNDDDNNNNYSYNNDNNRSVVSNLESALLNRESKNRLRGLNIFSEEKFNTSGYIWEGRRYEQGQDMVARMCLAQGPLWKAFDGYPIRVDPDSSVVDVVCREMRVNIRAAFNPEVKKNKHIVNKSKDISDQCSVLRRERFIFDDVFAGLRASDRMYLYMRQRTRKALECARNVVFLSLGCGEVLEGSVEPTVSVLLGNGGGTGIISNVIDEIFRYVKPLTLNLQSNPFKITNGKYNGTIRSSSPGNFAAVKVAQEQLTTRVLFSAVIVSCGKIYDLLDSSPGVMNSNFVTLKKRKSDGKVVLHNVSKLHLQTPADFDRVMGLLIGKRSAMSKVMHTLHAYSTKFKNVSMMDSDNIVQDVINSIDPWMGSNNTPWQKKHNYTTTTSQLLHPSDVLNHPIYHHNNENNTTVTSLIDDNNAAGDSFSTDSMVITISVSGGGISRSKTSIDFNFVCSCGENWSKPGTDINILTEIISSLPNSPPPSLIKASPLSLLLLDPRYVTTNNTNFINLAQVYRDENINNKNKNINNQMISSSLVQGALHSLRIVSK